MIHLTATQTEVSGADTEQAATEETFDTRDARTALAVRLPETLDAQRLHDAYTFIARLLLVAKTDEAMTIALGGLRRLLPAARWVLYYAQPLNVASGINLKFAASYPPRSSSDEDAEAAAISETNDTDVSVGKTASSECGPELLSARECARGAFNIGNLVRQSKETENLIALPLVADARIAAVLVGVREEEGGAWTDEDAGLLQSLALPLAAWLDHRRQASEAERLLLTDDLTKLRNPRYLRETLISEIKRARRYSTQLALLFLDLDNFKNVNDEYGHLVGSHALVEAAGAILGGVRNTDTVARYGGDEFVVVLPDTTIELAEQVAERIRFLIADHTFTGGRRLSLRLTASLGVAAFPAHAQSPQQLIAAADAAMYRAKAMRKNCVHVANDSPFRLAGI